MQRPIIDARQALQDIQSGMDDSALMKKYNLSTKGLKSLFNKLATAGLIREINPRELIRDIGFEISHAELMEKYKLSSVGLDRLLRDLEDFGLIPVAQQPKTRRDKVTIVLGEIVNDIRKRVPELKLMAKYDLSAAGIQRVFQKLLDTGAIEPTELLEISSSSDDTASISETRRVVRCYPILSLRVCEVGSSPVEGIVRDITETGVGTAGLRVSEGEEKHLLASVDHCLDIKPFLFKAVCRWFESEKWTSRCLAGFEMTEIFEESLRNLQEFIRLATVTFEPRPNLARR
jgi:predicted transcriptional regulator